MDDPFTETVTLGPFETNLVFLLPVLLLTVGFLWLSDRYPVSTRTARIIRIVVLSVLLVSAITYNAIR